MRTAFMYCRLHWLLCFGFIACTALAIVPVQQPPSAARPPAVSAEERALAANLAAARDEEAAASLVEANPGLRTHGLIAAIIDEGLRRDTREAENSSRLYRLASRLAAQIHDSEGEAMALNATGVLAGRQGRYDDALLSFKQAEEIAKRERLPRRLSQALANQGIVHRRRGDADLALDCNRRALAVFEELGDEDGQAGVLNNLGSLSFDLANLRAALDYFSQSLTIRQRIKSPEIGMTLANIGAVAELQGDLDTAIDYYRRGLNLAEQANDNGQIISSMSNLGHASLARGANDEALAWLQKALPIAERANLRYNSARIIYNIAAVLRAQGKLDAAVDQFKRSLEIHERIDDRIGIADSLTEIARTEFQMGKAPEALDAVDRAVAAAREGNNLTTLWAAQTIHGRCLENAGNLAGAERSYFDSIATVESIRELVAGGAPQRAQFFENRQEPYDRLIDLLVRERRNEEALAVVERAKARALLDALQGSMADVTRSMTDDERNRERKFRRALALAKSDLVTARSRQTADKSIVAKLSAQFEQARNDLADFETHLFSSHPELKIKRGKAPIVTPADLESLLPSLKSAALEFKATADRTYGFLITRRKSDAGSGVNISIYTIPMTREQIAFRTAEFRQRLAARDFEFQPLAK